MHGSDAIFSLKLNKSSLLLCKGVFKSKILISVAGTIRLILSVHFLAFWLGSSSSGENWYKGFNYSRLTLKCYLTNIICSMSTTLSKIVSQVQPLHGSYDHSKQRMNPTIATFRRVVAPRSVIPSF